MADRAGWLGRGAAVHGINIYEGGSYDTPTEHLVLRGLTIAGAFEAGLPRKRWPLIRQPVASPAKQRQGR